MAKVTLMAKMTLNDASNSVSVCGKAIEGESAAVWAMIGWWKLYGCGATSSVNQIDPSTQQIHKTRCLDDVYSFQYGHSTVACIISLPNLSFPYLDIFPVARLRPLESTPAEWAAGRGEGSLCQLLQPDSCRNSPTVIKLGLF